MKMDLCQDAIATTSSAQLYLVHHFSKGRINTKVLKEILDENDLDSTDITSIVFLMTNRDTNIPIALKILEECQKEELVAFINDQKEWKEKLLECLIVIENIYVLNRLGYTDDQIEEMKSRFLYMQHNISINLNSAIKSLYFLCKHMGKSKTVKFLTEVYKEFNDNTKINDTTPLEIHILNWLQNNYISINEGNANLNKLISALKTSDLLYNLPFEFNYWKVLNNVDSARENINSQSANAIDICSNDIVCNIDKNSKAPWSKEHNRLCIIINIVNFIDKKKYGIRSSSNEDVKKLMKTFKGCGFEIKDYNDLTAGSMMKLLNSLNDQHYSNYGSIFMCILSHGFAGEVVFIDGESITTDYIQDKFCCENLQNVLKFVILQSCQYKRKEPVASIESTKKNCLHYLHFGLFQSTMKNFGSVRHEREGSLFIEDVCKVLQELSPIKVLDFVLKVTERLSSRTFKLNDSDQSVQVPTFINQMSVHYELPKYNEVAL